MMRGILKKWNAHKSYQHANQYFTYQPMKFNLHKFVQKNPINIRLKDKM
jgi:hypothetical protein